MTLQALMERVTKVYGSRAEVRVRLCGGRWNVLVSVPTEKTISVTSASSPDEAFSRLLGAIWETEE